MNPIDPINHLSCTILGLKTALLEAERENRTLQKLLLSFYVKDAAKETNLYKMNRTGVKMNVLFQKEKQDLNMKIQELEARLTDSESENVNLNFQVRELKAFLEEKTNLLELYNPKNAKSDKLLLNNLKEKDLIQIIRNVLICMKSGRVSRALQKSLKSLELRKSRNLKKIKCEDPDAEQSGDEIDVMSTMIENRLNQDDFSFKSEKNVSSGLQSIYENYAMPAIELNDCEISDTDSNSSPGNAMECISMDQSIFSPVSISDSDYSSNGVKSVESLNSEKIQSAESSDGTNNSPVAVDTKPNSETNVVMVEEIVVSCETDILESKSNTELGCEINILPSVSHLGQSCIIDVLPAEDPEPSCEVDISSADFVAEQKFEIRILPVESDVKPSGETSVSVEEIATPSCETIVSPLSNNEASCETDIRPAKSHENHESETNLTEPVCKSDILPAECDSSDPMLETVPNLTEASTGDVQSDDIVSDHNENLECDPFIDPEIVNSAAELILAEMISITSSNTIIKYFAEFCKDDVRLVSDQNSTVPVQSTDKSLSESSVNPATELVSQNVGPESVPTKRKLDISSEDSPKKIRMDENVPHLSAESTALASVLDESMGGHKVHLLEDVLNQNSSKVEDEKTENTRPLLLENDIKIDLKVEHQVSVLNNTINQDICESSDVLLPHSEIQSDIVVSSKSDLAVDSKSCLDTLADENTVPPGSGISQSDVDKPVISPSDLQVSKISPVKSIFDVETDSIDFDTNFGWNEDTSASENEDDTSALIERVPDLQTVQLEVTENTNPTVDPKDTNHIEGPKNSKVEDTECSNEEETIINEAISVAGDTEKDSFSILNKFNVLEEEMRQRITTFKEFLLEKGLHCEIEMLDEMEYIVVAEILENTDFELSDPSALIADSALTKNILNSLHEASLKTVKLETSKENLGINLENQLLEESFMHAFDSMAEVNDSSDDEKDTLTIVEDDPVDENLVADTAVADENGVSPNEESNRKLISANKPEELVSKSRGTRSVSKDQPIKEITNVPRYNFRRSATLTVSPSETSVSSSLLPVEARSPECKHESVTTTVQEHPKILPMQFYVENQSSSKPPVYVSVFDEVWSQIKSVWCENSIHVTSDASDSMLCNCSVMKFVFQRKNKEKGLKPEEEKVLDVTSTKKFIEVYLQEKIRNQALAYSTLSLSVGRLNRTTLCCAIIEIILDSASTNNARRMDNISRDLLNLSVKLESDIFPGFVDALKNHLKSRMWTKDWHVKENGSLVNDLRLLSKFFTRLCTLDDDSASVISLLRESLFLFKFRGHPIAASVLNEWPDIFPRDARERTMLAHIILFTLVNHKMEYNLNLYNITEVQNLIATLFNVKLGMWTAEDYAKELMLRISDTTWEDAIVLLCKRQMFPWTYSNVIMKYLVPIMKKWKTEYFSEGIMSKVLRALKTLMGSCSYVKEENEVFKLEIIVDVLEDILSSPKGSRELKETVIVALCELSVFRFSQCVGILENWRPVNGVINRSTFQRILEQLPRYSYNWQNFLFPNSKSRYPRKNKYDGKDGSKEFHDKDSSQPRNTRADESARVTQNKNQKRPLSNKEMQDNAIAKNAESSVEITQSTDENGPIADKLMKNNRTRKNAVISVGMTQKMNSNRKLPNRLLKDNPIRKKWKGKKQKKRKGKPK